MSSLDYPISILISLRDKLLHPNLIKEISEAINVLNDKKLEDEIRERKEKGRKERETLLKKYEIINVKI